MSKHSKKVGFTLVELLVVICAIGILFALLLPSIAASSETSYRNQCQAKIKLIGLALNNHESAYNRFPLVFNAPTNMTPQSKTIGQAVFALPAGTGSGATPGSMTGWSWIVRILPYLEEANLYKNIDIYSSQFEVTSAGVTSNAPKGPFDPAIVNGAHQYQHCSCVFLKALICPSWAGNANTNGTTTVDNTATKNNGGTTGAPEYAVIPEQGNDAPAGFVDVPAPTNYKAVAGTHIATQGTKPLKWPVENGVMLISADTGATAASVSDGLSKTLLVAETKEWGYSSWYDGTLNWVVGNSPVSTIPPGGTANGGDGNDAPWVNAAVGINVGFLPTLSGKPGAGTTFNIPYLKPSQLMTPMKANENWGPSSDHSNGAVMHVFGDDHVAAITDQCDAATYLGLCTRAGSEAINSRLIR